MGSFLPRDGHQGNQNCTKNHTYVHASTYVPTHARLSNTRTTRTSDTWTCDIDITVLYSLQRRRRATSVEARRERIELRGGGRRWWLVDARATVLRAARVNRPPTWAPRAYRLDAAAGGGAVDASAAAGALALQGRPGARSRLAPQPCDVDDSREAFHEGERTRAGRDEPQDLPAW